MCISTTFTQVLDSESISIQCVLVLFGWTGEISQTPLKVPLQKRVRLLHIVVISPFGPKVEG